MFYKTGQIGEAKVVPPENIVQCSNCNTQFDSTLLSCPNCNSIVGYTQGVNNLEIKKNIEN